MVVTHNVALEEAFEMAEASPENTPRLGSRCSSFLETDHPPLSPKGLNAGSAPDMGYPTNINLDSEIEVDGVEHTRVTVEKSGSTKKSPCGTYSLRLSLGKH